MGAARPREAVGEIVLRGPWITGGYYNEPEKSAEVWRGGWFHTGDAAKIDDEGYITIADRIKDVIRSGSEMVPTVLLENLTATAEFVLEQQPDVVIMLGDDRIQELSNWLLVRGNLFLVFFASQVDGESTVRRIAPDEITEIVTNPDLRRPNSNPSSSSC